jgi:hypothetical protein
MKFNETDATAWRLSHHMDSPAERSDPMQESTSDPIILDRSGPRSLIGYGKRYVPARALGESRTTISPGYCHE